MGRAETPPPFSATLRSSTLRSRIDGDLGVAERSRPGRCIPALLLSLHPALLPGIVRGDRVHRDRPGQLRRLVVADRMRGRLSTPRQHLPPPPHHTPPSPP